MLIAVDVNNAIYKSEFLPAENKRVANIKDIVFIRPVWKINKETDMSKTSYIS